MKKLFNKFKKFMVSDDYEIQRKMLVVAIAIHFYRLYSVDGNLLETGLFNYILELLGAFMIGAIAVALTETFANIGKHIFKED